MFDGGTDAVAAARCGGDGRAEAAGVLGLGFLLRRLEGRGRL
jgi:hypothetical protein